MVFRGNFPAKLDAQGRIKIPTAHRKIFEERYGPDVFVTSISGENVLIYPLNEWEQIETRLLEPPKMRPAKVKFLRNTSYFGQVGNLDRQGRILIQPHLRETAGINGDLAVMGYLNYLEVWNRQKFEERILADPYTDEDASALADLGI